MNVPFLIWSNTRDWKCSCLFKKKNKCQRWKISYCCVFWAKSTLFIIWIITRPNVNMFIWWNIIHGAKMLFLLFCLSTGPVSRQHTSTSMTVLRQEWSLHLTWQHRVTHVSISLQTLAILNLSNVFSVIQPQIQNLCIIKIIKNITVMYNFKCNTSNM